MKPPSVEVSTAALRELIDVAEELVPVVEWADSKGLEVQSLLRRAELVIEDFKFAMAQETR
jgi:hypothetical protein